ncbi:predicted protein [Naegleria gruberi]|uniref:Predicted protein n=1 Tax=Naegleria gruberi TaxID=5762 RepID=D2W3P5_NAEGR|nr:uncharacterized protein NAEGRDRAFT_54716 [Naegleria gruberi]XP_002669042.1 uncharacterized protein NAEGRDRAFT_82256 [Naegleria gruberi]EFC35841.1 predicted protein [Naegleria gruberi]EFC36298.1 predicted protein [Naegleria gruberi]|eukprot:XP_002668585.1 predicted protein [Naegleria gruberi strain NEG-M]
MVKLLANKQGSDDDDDDDDYYSDDDDGDYTDDEDGEEELYNSGDRTEKEEFEKRMEMYMKEMLEEEGIDEESDESEEETKIVKKVVEPKKKKQKMESGQSASSSSGQSGVYFNVKFDLPRNKFNRVMCLSVQNANLRHLHNLLMYAFDWDDGHLHMFHTCKGEFTDRSMCQEGKEESKCRLDSVLNRSVDSIDYVYDFSSEWNISISLEKILTEQAMKAQAEKLNIELPNDLTKVVYCCGGLGGSIDEESGKKKGTFDINKENKRKFNIWN